MFASTTLCLSEGAWPTLRVAQILYTHTTLKQIIYYSLWIIICNWRPADPSGRKTWVCGRSRFGLAGSNPAWNFLFFELRTASGAHSASCWMDAGPQRGRCVKLTNDLHLVPNLRTSGMIPLLRLYTFMAWTETALPFCLLRLSNRMWFGRKRSRSNRGSNPVLRRRDGRKPQKPENSR